MNTDFPSRRTVFKWNLFFQYTTIALSIVSGVVMVPLYLRHIPLSLYGGWLASGNILNWLTSVDPGLSTVLQRETAHAYGRKDLRLVGEYFWGGLTITVFIVALFLTAAALILPFLFQILKLNPTTIMYPLKQAFTLQVYATAIFLITFTIVAFNNALLGSKGVGVISVVSPITGLVVTLSLLLRGHGLIALPYGSLVQAIVACAGNVAYAAYRIHRDAIPFSFTPKKITDISKLLSFTYLGRISGIISENFDLLIASRYLGAEMVPILNLTRKVPEIMRRFTDRPMAAIMPTLSHYIGEKGPTNAKPLMLRLIRMILWAVLMCGTGFIALNGDFIGLWVGPQFFAGNSVNLALTGVFIFSSLAYSLWTLCFALGDIKGTSIISFLQTLVCIPLSIWGVAHWGMLGLVLGAIIPMASISLVYYGISLIKRLELSTEEYRGISIEILKCSVLSAITAVIFLEWQPSTWVEFATAGVFLMSFFTTSLFALSGEFRKEIFALMTWAGTSSRLTFFPKMPPSMSSFF